LTIVLDQIRIIIEQVILAFSYPGIAAVMFIETVFPPIPSEVVMPFAGFLVAEGKISFLWIIIAGNIGAISGAVMIYYLGYLWGEESTRAWFRKYGKYILVNEVELDRAMRTFDRYGKGMVLIGRMIPGIRSLISLPAGIKRMSWGSFFLYTLIGTTMWNIILGAGGYLMGQQWERILDWLDSYETVVYAAVSAFVLYWIGRKIFQTIKGPVKTESN